MEGRVSGHQSFPGKHHKHYDVIRANENGSVLLGTSNRTSRRWSGSIWYYVNTDHTDHLHDPFKCASAVAIDSGINDLVWLGQEIVIAGLDTGAVAGWLVNTEETPLEPLWQAREHDDLVRALGVYTRENRIVSASHDGTVKIWDIEENVGNCTRTYRGHSDIISSLDHRQEAPIFVTCSRDGYVIVWDSRQAKPAQRYGNFSQNGPTSVRWQPGSENLVVGDVSGQLHFGDLRKADDFSHYDAHKDRLTNLEFSPCGTMLATGGHDCRVHVWKLSSDGVCDEILCSREHNDYIRGLTWRSGSDVLSCSLDGRIVAHSTTPGVTPGMDVNFTGSGNECGTTPGVTPGMDVNCTGSGNECGTTPGVAAGMDVNCTGNGNECGAPSSTEDDDK